jgi:(2Fe-2S) ferredoxin
MAKPEKHVFVCVQARAPGHPRGSCAANGCGAVMDEFLQQFQDRNLFERFAITNTGCLGPCSSGPNALVYPEGVMYGKLTKDDVATIIDQHLLGGTPVESLLLPPDIWG